MIVVVPARGIEDFIQIHMYVYLDYANFKSTDQLQKIWDLFFIDTRLAGPI